MSGTDRTSDSRRTTFGPWVEMPRAAWAELAADLNVSLNAQTIDRLRGLDDPTDSQDIQEVYLPLTELIGEYTRNTRQLYYDSNSYLGLSVERTPFVIAIAGSVAVGKSTVARLLKELLGRTHGRPKVELVTTDGFLHPNAELARRGLLDRKGFPASYDTQTLLRFVVDVKSGLPEVTAPVYSHTIYDIVPDQHITVRRPDILILEGLNVLQPAPQREGRAALSVSDFLDFSVYVDAAETDIRAWFISRFLRMRYSAFTDPNSFFREFALLSDDEANAVANQVWDEINGPNLRQNIAPTRDRATAILVKGANHAVEAIRIRKV